MIFITFHIASDFLAINKPDRARIRVESIIREDVSSILCNHYDDSPADSFSVLGRGDGDFRDVLRLNTRTLRACYAA